MTDKELAQLNGKLDVITNLLAFHITKGLTVTEGAPILNKLGMSAGDIAIILDSTPNAIGVRLSEAKKKPPRRTT